jgi:hypothetical protein
MLSPDLDELLAQLNQIAPQLSPTRLALLNRMAISLQMGFDSLLNPDSDIATPLFSECFASRLLLHHAVGEENLNKKSFEYLFRDALRHDGKIAEITASGVSPGADIVVDGTRISLKTEASKDIRDRKITISKLMEARWIRDQDALGLARLAGDRLREHLAGYDRIIMLRAFNPTKSQVKYNLMEIPHALLTLALGLQPGDIKLNLGRNGGGSVVFRDQGLDVFTLRFDGSVEKVTVTNLLVDRCISHGMWNIPLGHHL